MNSPTILIIEDENPMSRLLATVMQAGGYNYHLARNGKDGLMLAMTRKPDVILTNLGLPDMDGLEIIKSVRSWSQIPIVVLSSRDEDADKVAALDAGADDYIAKPFSIDELMARIRVALRHGESRAQAQTAENSIYINGSLSIDFTAGSTYIKEEEVHLTPIEFRIISYLAKNTGKVVTHNQLLKAAWGTPDQTELPSLRVFITSLRKKLRSAGGDDMIQTMTGVGYRLNRVK